jgi:hypothetical protein
LLELFIKLCEISFIEEQFETKLNGRAPSGGGFET